MRGWLRYFALNAQVRTGVSGWVLVWALIAAAAAAAAAVFLLVAAFVWLADRYGSLTAGVVLGCAFALIALIALLACLIARRRNMQRARLELAARSTTSWLDPKLVAVGVQIGQAIGWRRLRFGRLVSRFRSSQYLAAHSHANFGIKGTLANF